jgi:hypothetical protein
VCAVRAHERDLVMDSSTPPSLGSLLTPARLLACSLSLGFAQAAPPRRAADGRYVLHAAAQETVVPSGPSLRRPPTQEEVHDHRLREQDGFNRSHHRDERKGLTITLNRYATRSADPLRQQQQQAGKTGNNKPMTIRAVLDRRER